MRLWSVHPRHLDRVGLVACWREALLAQAVLAGNTRGYQFHPQLIRFRAAPEPLVAIGGYLEGIVDEADARGYRFDRAKILLPPARSQIGSSDPLPRITVTRGQLAYERDHLARKLAVRSPADAARLDGADVSPHPSFRVVEGEIEEWERP